MSPRTSSSHNSSPVSNQLTMSSVTNSPAGLMNNMVHSSPHSSTGSLVQANTTTSPHGIQTTNSSPQSGDELLLNDNLILNNNSSTNSLNNQANAHNPPNGQPQTVVDNGLNQMVHNQSPLNNSSTSSPLSNGLGPNGMMKEPDLKGSEMYNNQTSDSTLSALISNNSTSNNQTSPSSSIKMHHKLDPNDNLNSSINSSSNLAQQWTGPSQPPSNNNFTTARYQNTSSYQASSQFAGNQTINSSANSSSSFQSTSQQHLTNSSNLNSSNQLINASASSNQPYLDYNGYSLNQPSSQASSSTVPTNMFTPNMFTAAAVQAAQVQAANSGIQQQQASSKASDFPFNNNSNLNKKYLTNVQSSVDGPSGLPPSDGLESSLDPTLLYGTTTANGSTPLNKSTTLQSSLVKPPPHQSTEFSASLANNYANFGPNSNAYKNWQVGSTPQQQQQQLGMTNGSNNMYQPKQIQMQLNNLQQHPLHHTPSSGHDEASQASTPNSQLDELRSDTPNTKLNSQTNGQAYLTSAMNGVSNNSSSNSSTGSMASSANSLNGKGMPNHYSFPPTPNTIGSPGASVMSTFYDEYESTPNYCTTKNTRADGLMKLYEISNEPARKLFLDKLIAFNEERSTSINSCPSINKGLIDLFKLYTLVKDRGGFIQTTKTKLWKEIANILGIKQQATSAYILRKQYIKHLLPFECKFDLNGANPDQVQASTENANRKKRKNKGGNEMSGGSIPPPGMQTPPNSANSLVLGSSNGQPVMQSTGVAKDALASMGPNAAQAQSNSNLPPNLHQQSLNQQLSNRQLPPHLAMQQQASYSTPLPNSMNGAVFQAAGPNGGAYNNYAAQNGSYNGSGAVGYGPNSLYATNGGMYSQSTTVDYQGKLNHQLSSAQQAQFFANSNAQQQQQMINANQAALVNSQQNAQLHSSLTNSLSNQANQQQTINVNALSQQQQQQFYSQQSNNPAMYAHGGVANGSLISGSNGQPSANEFYSNAGYSSGGLVHGSNGPMYSTSAQQQLNSMSSAQYNDEMMLKYGGASGRQTELNSSQSSLTSSNQLNSSNNQYYNGLPADSSNNPNTPNSYATSNSIYGRSNGYQLNGYSNGMLESGSFVDKNLDFHTSIKSSDPTTNLDNYLSDPYSYEPETKRFHAMSNC